MGSWRMASAPALRDTTECIIVAHKGSGTLPIPPEHIHQDARATIQRGLPTPIILWSWRKTTGLLRPNRPSASSTPPFPAELVTRLFHFYAYPGAHVLTRLGQRVNGRGRQATRLLSDAN